jgi:RNA polymerase sigma factor (sigma-70 family)
MRGSVEAGHFVVLGFRSAGVFHSDANWEERMAGTVVQGELDYAVYLEPVRRAVGRTARRSRLSSADADDLHSELWVRLLRDRGLLVRQFRGAASLESYLGKVARNLVIDRRRKAWGKWRPTASALRAGAVVVQLEKMITRDGLSPDVAVACFHADHPEMRRDFLEQVAHSVAPKARRRTVPEAVLVARVSPEPSPYEAVRRVEDERTGASLSRVLAAALRSFSPRERNLIVWRYAEGRPVADIARALDVDHKALYRRFETLRKRLRQQLESGGFGVRAVTTLLDSECEIRCAAVRAEVLPAAPSRRAIEWRETGQPFRAAPDSGQQLAAEY